MVVLLGTFSLLYINKSWGKKKDLNIRILYVPNFYSKNICAFHFFRCLLGNIQNWFLFIGSLLIELIANLSFVFPCTTKRKCNLDYLLSENLFKVTKQLFDYSKINNSKSIIYTLFFKLFSGHNEKLIKVYFI